MARKSSPTISQEELYPSNEDAVRPDLDDGRMLDLDGEAESPFLRAQKRVSVRRGPLPKKAANRLKWVLIAAAVLGVVAGCAASLYNYGEHSWRFRLQSSDDIEITGNQAVSRAQVMEVMGGDIGRNIFFVRLSQRKAQLEQIPWVESAAVMRFIPNRLKVEIRERTPVAFVRIGSRIALIDTNGVVMDLAGKKKYSFPVIVGMSSGEPISTRAARMKTYNELVREMDSTGAHYSQDISEVDLSDPDDVKVVANDNQGAVLVHLGPGNFLDRYKIYVAHVQDWRQQFEKLDSVDLRYDRQIIVNPDLCGVANQPPLSAAAARVATAAGVKHAALLTHETPLWKSRAIASAKVAAKPVSTRKPVSKWRAKHMARRATPKAVAKSTVASARKPIGPPKLPASPVAKSAAASAVSKKPSPAIAKEQGNQ